jgi:hypothetical protein
MNRFSPFVRAGVAAAGLWLSGAAMASPPVAWSIGVQGQGVHVTATSGRPVLAYPMPVHAWPVPVHAVPAPVWVAPPRPYGSAWGYAYPGRHPHAVRHSRDLNRDGIPDRRQDANRDGVPDARQDRNRDGWPDWTAVPVPAPRPYYYRH